jgi:hypothetical protein
MVTKMLRRTPQQQIAALLAGAVSVVGWLVWLGWHEQKHRVPGTHDLEGPYETWQVAGLIATLAVTVAVATWLGFAKNAVFAVSVGTTVMFSIDAATQPSPDADMWPAGALLLFLGSFAGLALLAFFVDGVRPCLAERGK